MAGRSRSPTTWRMATPGRSAQAWAIDSVRLVDASGSEGSAGDGHHGGLHRQPESLTGRPAPGGRAVDGAHLLTNGIAGDHGAGQGRPPGTTTALAAANRPARRLASPGTAFCSATMIGMRQMTAATEQATLA